MSVLGKTAMITLKHRNLIKWVQHVSVITFIVKRLDSQISWESLGASKSNEFVYLQFLNNVIINKTKVPLPQTELTSADFGYAV